MGTEVPASDFLHNVLLIEDNPGDARLIREMLAEQPEAPFQLHFAERLAHGLELLSKGCEAGGEAGAPALVLLDLSLPDSFGLETFAKVYAHSPQVPIIVLTGNDDGGEGRRAGLPRQEPARSRAAAALDAVLDRAQALSGAARAPGQL